MFTNQGQTLLHQFMIKKYAVVAIARTKWVDMYNTMRKHFSHTPQTAFFLFFLIKDFDKLCWEAVSLYS